MVGVNGNKFPEIRAHLQNNIAEVYKDLDVSYVVCFYANGDSMVLEPLSSSFDSFPGDTETNPEACAPKLCPGVILPSSLLHRQSSHRQVQPRRCCCHFYSR